MTELHADGYFGIMPDWVIFSAVSDRAKVLYAILSLHCDYTTRECKLGRKRMAEMMGCSVDTIDRLKTELTDVRALSVTKKKSSNGAHDHNVYMVRRTHPDLTLAAPDAATPAAPDAATLAARGAAHVKTHDSELLLLDEAAPPEPGFPLESVDGRKVTRGEAGLALEILAAFNEAAGTKFRSKEYLRGVVGRLREHPELTAKDHAGIIERALRKPWWKDDPAPNVIYGNETTFERALHAGQKGKNVQHDARFDRFDT